jgi:integrase
MAANRRPPKLCLHKPSGNARCWINGKEHWLGRYGTPECERRYRALIAHWARSPAETPPPPLPLNRVTIADVLAQYLIEIRGSDSGSKLRSNARWWLARSMAKELESLSSVRLTDLGPKMFAAWVADVAGQPIQRRGEMTTRTITHVRKIVAEFLRMIEWCVAEEIIGPEKLVALRAVRRLPVAAARPPEFRTPVDEAKYQTICQHLPPAFAAIVTVLRHSAARPSEVLRMTPAEIDMHREQGVWLLFPSKHKTMRYGRPKCVVLGPRCQDAIRPWLAGVSNGDRIFTPASIARVSSPSSIPTRKYRKASLVAEDIRRAVKIACRAAGIEHWVPYQLRHNSLTEFRQAGGLDAAQQQGGHSSSAVTERYAAADRSKAIAAAKLVG